MKNICILGSTGSIGKNSLEVLAALRKQFRVAYLTTNTNIRLLEKQIKQYEPKAVAVLDERAAIQLRQRVNGSTKIFNGAEGILELASRNDVDVVINSVVGFAGLQPTIEAIKHRKTVALANKETLVVAGELIMRLAGEYGVSIIPIDSEHSAILQCLAGENKKNISRLILTASGGPLLHVKKKNFPEVTVAQALNHPNWTMGNKITIDSATLMNKGLEVIEARWLFDLPVEMITVLIHPQSIIHSMVEFVDGSLKAQMGVPDMKIPIQYALTYPDRSPSDFKRLNIAALKEMTFMKPDIRKFECLRLAYEALRRGGTAPAVLNAANEIAVALFLGGKISFDRIPGMIRTAMHSVPHISSPLLEDIVETDRITRLVVQDAGERLKKKGSHASS